MDSSLPSAKLAERRDDHAAAEQPAPRGRASLRTMASLVADQGPAGRMLRSVLPIALGLIFLSGTAVLTAYHDGLIRIGRGTVLFSIADGVIVVITLFWSAWLLNAEHLARRETQERVRRYALHDPLTGLANRSFFMDQLARRAALADRRTNVAFAVCSLELDGFRQVQQQFGKEAGERILIKVGDVLRDCIRASDAIARLEDGKFAILLEEIAGAPDIDALARRIVAAIPPALQKIPGGSRISACVGIVMKSSGHDLPSDILRDADAALSLAKKKGPGRFELTAFAD